MAALLMPMDGAGAQKRKGLMLQPDAAVRYLHVGMLQHDPAGRLAFLHRTAEGKFLPQRDSFRRFHLLTVPLSPSRAAALLGGLHKHMGYEAFQVGHHSDDIPLTYR